MKMTAPKPWFAAKRYGLGAGLPLCWQGWLMLGLHVALIVALTLFFAERPGLLLPLVLVSALLPMPLYAAKTEGGWRWRWGEED